MSLFHLDQEKLDEAMQRKFLNVLKSIRTKGHEGGFSSFQFASVFTIS